MKSSTPDSPLVLRTPSILCRCGKQIFVDEDVYEQLAHLLWRCSATAVFQDGVRNTYTIAHLVIAVPLDKMPDHINRDYHDNRRENLRLATRAENMANSKRRSDNRSGYRGVSWSKVTRSWAYQVTKGNVTRRGTGFKTAIEAAEVYNEIAKELYGKFAYQNEI